MPGTLTPALSRREREFSGPLSLRERAGVRGRRARPGVVGRPPRSLNDRRTPPTHPFPLTPMRSSSLFFRLAVQDVRHRPVRAALLALAVALAGGSAFTATVLRRAIRDSMGVSLDRLGADVMVVPRETTVNL